MNHNSVEWLDDHGDEKVDQQKSSIWEQVFLLTVLLVVQMLYQQLNRQPIPDPEKTRRLLIVVVGVVLIVMTMVLGGVGSEVDDVIKHLPFLL